MTGNTEHDAIDYLNWLDGAPPRIVPCQHCGYPFLAEEDEINEHDECECADCKNSFKAES